MAAAGINCTPVGEMAVVVVISELVYNYTTTMSCIGSTGRAFRGACTRKYAGDKAIVSGESLTCVNSLRFLKLTELKHFIPAKNTST
uniref:Uncharacterized protein n=1 Tax=Megaselia scalaris TaxID=36166 RepID=T1GGV6_MEGSC